MEKIKVGVIGTGFAGTLHIEALRRLGNVEVVALADINQEVADEKSIALSVPKVFGDYKKLLADLEIQVVHICTPNNLHFQMSKEALEAGKHVVCEKPLAMKSPEAVELAKIAKEKNLVNAVHFNIRFYPLIHQAKKMIEEGMLGKIFAVNGSYQQDWLFYDIDYNWRLELQVSGDSRAVADIGSHWFDSIEFITGIKVSKVCADFATFYPIRKKPFKPVETYSGKLLKPGDYEDISIKTEDYATILLRFERGAHGSLTVNQVAAGRKNRMYFEIYGSMAAIAYDSERPNEMWVGYRQKYNEIIMKDPSLLFSEVRSITDFPGGHNEGFPDTSKQMFKKIYRYIKEKGHEKSIIPDFPTFKEGLRELKICEAIVKSAREEKWILIDEKL